MKSILLAATLAMAMSLPAFGNEEHHPAADPAATPNQSAAPTPAQTPASSTQAGMMADCPMMKGHGMAQGQAMGADGASAMTQGDNSAGMQNGQQMMQDGKMQCPMMNNKTDGKPATDEKPADH
jgi:hypothetical protein